jgi:hypothetical protein
MSNLRHAAVLAVGLAAAGSAWAQAPKTPTSPDDPLSKSLGWVEAPPGSQATAPASPATAPAPQAAVPAPQAPVPDPDPRASAALSQAAPPPREPAPPAPPPVASAPQAPAPSATAAPPGRTAAATAAVPQKAPPARAKQPQRHVREEAPAPATRSRFESTRDHMANQLNRQQLGNMSAGTAASPSPTAPRR